MKIYVAGPLGFSEIGRSFQRTVLFPELLRLGYEVLDPWQLTDPRKIDAACLMPYGSERRETWRTLNGEIAANNRSAIDRCDVLLAVLDGVDVDSGTAAEIGYAFAIGKRIIGYRGDSRSCGDNEAAIVNLQVEYFIAQSGGRIVSQIAEIEKALSDTRRHATS